MNSARSRVEAIDSPDPSTTHLRGLVALELEGPGKGETCARGRVRNHHVGVTNANERRRLPAGASQTHVRCTWRRKRQCTIDITAPVSRELTRFAYRARSSCLLLV